MKLEQNLDIKQAQKLVMTPELKQAIALLQMPAVQLLEFLQEEMINNPVLEWEEDKENSGEYDEKVETGEEEFPWEYYFSENNYEENTGVASDGYSTSHVLENTYSNEESLLDELCSQVRMLFARKDHSLGEYLIGCLDADGYLRLELQEIAYALKVPKRRIKEVLKLIQDYLEPPGIGARSLKECLLIQMRRNMDYPELVEELLNNYLPAVADGRYSYLSGQLDVSLEKIFEAVDYIKTLNPRPGNLWGSLLDVRFINPDVIVEKVEGEYVIHIPENSSPYIKINPYYRSLLHDNKSEGSVYIKKCLDRAMWLLKSIEQRRITLYRVSEIIVNEQQGFLEHGLKYLSPLTLKKVAASLEMHESTVSRATSNKYMQTPLGLFPFKFFFTSSLQGEDGQNYSSTSIKSYIKELISQESPEKPYSDSKLAGLLNQEGIEISRRTVAKYREELYIPSSQKRKQKSRKEVTI